MDSYIKNTHPDAEQLTGYMESPESSEHTTIRKHLMACEQCRVRIDKLLQLELDVKHFVPRFSPPTDLNNSDEQNIERFIDNQLDADDARTTIRQISSNPESLKSALHYAVHSAAMSRNIDTINSGIRSKKMQTDTRQGSTGSIFSQFFKYLQWPTPAWAIAPATLAITAILSFPLISTQVAQQNTGPQIAKFQDNAVISYSSADIPAGSIGFFHDAKSRTEPFSGINIVLNQKKGLDLSWPAIDKVNSYQLTLYSFENGQKQQIVSKETVEPNTHINNIDWETGKHYQWKISGLTQDGLKYSTYGDFVLINKPAD